MKSGDKKVTVPSFDVVVVGSGFAGMYALYRLKKMGLRVRVFEAGSDFGGTWFWNRYPGARCDIESLEYSYSFSEALQQEWQWSEKYAAQPEILKYINHVAERFSMRDDVEFNTRVVSANFNADANDWLIATDTGETVRASFCVMGTGCLSNAQTPDVPGLSSFEGESYHTGNWPHQPVSFKGKRVGVIGTGSSGIQVIPQLAQQASELFVFQRTPAYSIPARNTAMTPTHAATIKTNYAERREQARHSFTGRFGGTVATQAALEVSEQERLDRYQDLWNKGGITFTMAFTDLIRNMDANASAAEFVRTQIRSVVKDPKVAEALCPDTAIGAKRLCADNGYYDVYNQPHVRLVDLSQEPIREIVADGLATSAGRYALDAIVFATGFDAMTGALRRIDIRGSGGVELRQEWAAGPRTYLGLMIAGFPNLFLVTGPGSPSVLSNMIVSIEQHVDWISDCIDHLRGQRMDRIEASVDAQAEWVTHVNEVADDTLLGKANSWYVGANVPGKPRVFMPYVGGVGEYRRRCDEVAANGYAGFVLSRQPAETFQSA